jgi:dihydropteroate synthase
VTRIGRIKIVEDLSPKVMGIINTSPESFYKYSIFTTIEEISNAAKYIEKSGAHIIDIGAMSTAPYLETTISIEKESKRMKQAIRAVKNSCSLPVSADTQRSEVAKEAIDCGADAINDITGLKYDKNMAYVVSKSKLPIIIGAYSEGSKKSHISGGIQGTINLLKESLMLAKEAKIPDDNIVIDPSIGFFRTEGKNPFFTHIEKVPWYVRDIDIISNLKKLRGLLKPICVSVSRKSFIGNIFNLKTEERFVPSVLLELICILNGANLIRTHDVKEAVQAVILSHFFRG